MRYLSHWLLTADFLPSTSQPFSFSSLRSYFHQKPKVISAFVIYMSKPASHGSCSRTTPFFFIAKDTLCYKIELSKSFLKANYVYLINSAMLIPNLNSVFAHDIPVFFKLQVVSDKKYFLYKFKGLQLVSQSSYKVAQSSAKQHLRVLDQTFEMVHSTWLYDVYTKSQDVSNMYKKSTFFSVTPCMYISKLDKKLFLKSQYLFYTNLTILLISNLSSISGYHPSLLCKCIGYCRKKHFLPF